jgi:hypothetical protein
MNPPMMRYDRSVDLAIGKARSAVPSKKPTQDPEDSINRGGTIEEDGISALQDSCGPVSTNLVACNSAIGIDPRI